MSNDNGAPGPWRPCLRGTRHMVACGHHMAAQAGLEVLEAGGNAVDAGVAAGIALGVLETEFVSFGGVAPILIRMADSGEVTTISGLGPWPKAASCEYFQEHHDGVIPAGLLRSVVPAAPDAWITALERFGTLSFGDVAAAAIRLAGDGFPMYPIMAHLIREHRDTYADWPTSAAIFLPGGEPPRVGDRFVQRDLAASLQYLVDEERAKGGGDRLAGLRAAREAFYRGDIAEKIVRYHRDNGGLMTAADLSDFQVGVEPPVHVRFGDIDVFGCGPWCQGPMLLQALNILDGLDLKAMGHNTPRYLHALAEAIKLAAADRDAYYGDPKFVDVPMAALLDKDYAAQRRAMIREREAWPDRPPPGKVGGTPWPGETKTATTPSNASPEALSAADTSYVCAVDKDGNAFSATPSDGSTNDPVIAGTGLLCSPRGISAWTDPAHPCAVGPGKRPRLTPNPALAMRDGDFVMPFGTPGGDVQTQAMLQVLLNTTLWGMDPQTAIETPRMASYSFPSSFWPHESLPGRLNVESRMDDAVVPALADLGHDAQWWPDWTYQAGSVCAIRQDLKRGVLEGGADPRRAAYGAGW